MAKSKVVYRYKGSWWKRSWDRLLFLLLLGMFILIAPGQNRYFSARPGSREILRRLPFALPTPAPYPVHATGIVPGSEISGTGVVIFDVASGVYLYKRNGEELFAPASTTKIMTALVALDYYGLDDVLTVKMVANTGQTMKLVAGERMTVENLLYGTLIQSANDAAYALAQNYPGGADTFVEAMNKKASALHLTKSHFVNPVGYDDAAHKMTPIDLARLASIALSNPILTKMVAIPQITISDVTHTYFHSLSTVNQLLGKISGVGGVKTGWTEAAGENLVTLVERNGHKVIIVLLHSRDRFGETAKLIDWVFGNYRWESFEQR